MHKSEPRHGAVWLEGGTRERSGGGKVGRQGDSGEVTGRTWTGDLEGGAGH